MYCINTFPDLGSSLAVWEAPEITLDCSRALPRELRAEALSCAAYSIGAMGIQHMHDTISIHISSHSAIAPREVLMLM